MLDLTENKTVGTEAVIPENAVENVQEIKIDNLTIKAHLTGKAHSITDVMYELVEDKLLFTGDNITYHRIPRMVDGSFVGNIAAADYGLNLPVDVVVPGHGPTGGKEVLSAYRDYLSTIYETSKALAEEGLETYEMKEKILNKLAAYKDWAGLEEQLGKHISQSVTEAEEADF
jgi:glyoxylase-like metal-dependent hydrolase (beta-lactamase superfamily II)